MFLKEKSSSTAKKVADEERGHIYMLMRSYIEHECKSSHTFMKQRDLDQEVQNRLAKIFS